MDNMIMISDSRNQVIGELSIKNDTELYIKLIDGDEVQVNDAVSKDLISKININKVSYDNLTAIFNGNLDTLKELINSNVDDNNVSIASSITILETKLTDSLADNKTNIMVNKTSLHNLNDTVLTDTKNMIYNNINKTRNDGHNFVDIVSDTTDNIIDRLKSLNVDDIIQGNEFVNSNGDDISLYDIDAMKNVLELNGLMGVVDDKLKILIYNIKTTILDDISESIETNYKDELIQMVTDNTSAISDVFNNEDSGIFKMLVDAINTRAQVDMYAVRLDLRYYLITNLSNLITDKINEFMDHIYTDVSDKYLAEGKCIPTSSDNIIKNITGIIFGDSTDAHKSSIKKLLTDNDNSELIANIGDIVNMDNFEKIIFYGEYNVGDDYINIEDITGETYSENDTSPIPSDTTFLYHDTIYKTKINKPGKFSTDMTCIGSEENGYIPFLDDDKNMLLTGMVVGGDYYHTFESYENDKHYYSGDRVIIDNKLYEATQDTIGNIPSNNIGSPLEFIGGITPSNVSEYYYVNNIIISNNKLYRCVLDHKSISQISVDDVLYWEFISNDVDAQNMGDDVKVKKNTVVRLGNSVYRVNKDISYDVAGSILYNSFTPIGKFNNSLINVINPLYPGEVTIRFDIKTNTISLVLNNTSSPIYDVHNKMLNCIHSVETSDPGVDLAKYFQENIDLNNLTASPIVGQPYVYKGYVFILMKTTNEFPDSVVPTLIWKNLGNIYKIKNTDITIGTMMNRLHIGDMFYLDGFASVSDPRNELRFKNKFIIKKVADNEISDTDLTFSLLSSYDEDSKIYKVSMYGDKTSYHNDLILDNPVIIRQPAEFLNVSDAISSSVFLHKHFEIVKVMKEVILDMHIGQLESEFYQVVGHHRKHNYKNLYFSTNNMKTINALNLFKKIINTEKYNLATGESTVPIFTQADFALMGTFPNMGNIYSVIHDLVNESNLTNIESDMYDMINGELLTNIRGTEVGSTLEFNYVPLNITSGVVVPKINKLDSYADNSYDANKYILNSHATSDNVIKPENNDTIKHMLNKKDINGDDVLEQYLDDQRFMEIVEGVNLPTLLQGDTAVLNSDGTNDIDLEDGYAFNGELDKTQGTLHDPTDADSVINHAKIEYGKYYKKGFIGVVESNIGTSHFKTIWRALIDIESATVPYTNSGHINDDLVIDGWELISNPWYIVLYNFYTGSDNLTGNLKHMKNVDINDINGVDVERMLSDNKVYNNDRLYDFFVDIMKKQGHSYTSINNMINEPRELINKIKDDVNNISNRYSASVSKITNNISNADTLGEIKDLTAIVNEKKSMVGYKIDKIKHVTDFLNDAILDETGFINNNTIANIVLNNLGVTGNNYSEYNDTVPEDAKDSYLSKLNYIAGIVANMSVDNTVRDKLTDIKTSLSSLKTNLSTSKTTAKTVDDRTHGFESLLCNGLVDDTCNDIDGLNGVTFNKLNTAVNSVHDFQITATHDKIDDLIQNVGKNANGYFIPHDSPLGILKKFDELIGLAING